MYLWTTVAILHKISLVSWWLRSAETGHSLSNPFVIHFSRVFKTCTGLMSSFINVSTVIRWNKNISKSFILISKCAKHLIYEMTCIQLPSSIYWDGILEHGSVLTYRFWAKKPPIYYSSMDIVYVTYMYHSWCDILKE